MLCLQNNVKMKDGDPKEEGSSCRKIEEDDTLRLVQCLRGRLLAERQASRAAKEEAKLMCKMLTELEKKLKEEIRCRDRAEKKLKLLKGKLELLKIPQAVDKSERTSSVCCISSSSSDNLEILQAPEVEEAESQGTATETPQSLENSLAISPELRQSQDSRSSENVHDSLTPPSNASKSESHCGSSSRMEDLMAGTEAEDCIDNSPALVAVTALVVETHQTKCQLKKVNAEIAFNAATAGARDDTHTTITAPRRVVPVYSHLPALLPC